jgi:hypothetical protein
MAQFTTRVELHSASESDYTVLHRAMEQSGFLRTITSDDATVHHLPTAEYNYLGTVTRSHVLDLAKAAAAATKKSFCVLVTESAGRTWYKLPEVS